MATKTYEFTGEAMWAKVYPKQLDPKYKRWSIDVAVRNTADFKASGCQLEPKKFSKKDPEYPNYRKSSDNLFFYGFGVKAEDGAPEVVDAEGQPFDQLIGNGSVVTVEVDIYDYTYQGESGKGSRLKKVIVEEWVEYKKDEPEEKPRSVSKKAVPVEPEAAPAPRKARKFDR